MTTVERETGAYVLQPEQGRVVAVPHAGGQVTMKAEKRQTGGSLPCTRADTSHTPSGRRDTITKGGPSCSTSWRGPLPSSSVRRSTGLRPGPQSLSRRAPRMPFTMPRMSWHASWLWCCPAGSKGSSTRRGNWNRLPPTASGGSRSTTRGTSTSWVPPWEAGHREEVEAMDTRGVVMNSDGKMLAMGTGPARPPLPAPRSGRAAARSSRPSRLE